MDALADIFAAALGDRIQYAEALGEVGITVEPEALLEVSRTLRNHPDLHFEMLIDLCGVDYQAYRDGAWSGRRFAVVYHLLSVKHNRRVRMKAFPRDEEFPVLESAVGIWPVADWFEREAFDLFGIMFSGHPDLRRILTDYGFVGHPFRKDFPLSGNVEVRYDPAQQRVIYQPVTVEPREVTPRIVRVEHYGEVDG